METYARDMAAGDFALTETIIVSDKGRTMNCQHRLNACILSGKPIDAVMIMGVPDSAFLKLDSGEKRRPVDWSANGSCQARRQQAGPTGIEGACRRFIA